MEPENLRDSGSFDGAALPANDAREVFRRAKLLSGKPVGHTSVVFKVKLEGGLTAAWKPDSRRGKDRYRGEVAARRLASALGLPNVPEVCLRSFSKADLLRLLDPDGAALVTAEALVDSMGQVPGALVPWIADLTFPSLEAEPSLSRWRSGLAGKGDAASIDLDELRLADISTLIAFDALTGNWDRWSGANIGKDPSSGRLLFIDNDAAFSASPPPDGLTRNLRLLGATKRFSRAFVTALSGLDPTRLEEIFGTDLAGAPLLSAKAVAGVRARLVTVRAALDAAGPEGLRAFP